VQVKVIEIDPQGKVRLSRKEMLGPAPEGSSGTGSSGPSRGRRRR